MKKIFIKPLLIVFMAMSIVFSLNACNKDTEKKNAEMPAEAQKYVLDVKKFAANRDLALQGFAGVTYLKTNDLMNASETHLPVVYEWHALNTQTNKKVYIQVGPIMPFYKSNPKIKVPYMISHERYGASF